MYNRSITNILIVETLYLNPSNFIPLFDDIGLDPNTDMLWLMYHNGQTSIDELKKHPLWNSRKQIHLLDCQPLMLFQDLDWKNDERIHVWAPAVFDHPRFHLHQWWFNWMQEIESYIHATNKLDDVEQKPYYFDAMLGNTSPNKQPVNNLINNCKNKELFFRGGRRLLEEQESWSKGLDEEDDLGFITYNQQQRAQSPCAVPYLFYNKCWYTIVVETDTNSADCPFYSEKTGKALLGKRLFVTFSAQHHLRHLHLLGFKTFDGIIDESYDNEPNIDKRYAMAWEQVEFLLTQDPIDIYNKSKQIVEHNYHHFMRTNWQNMLEKEIQNISHLSK